MKLYYAPGACSFGPHVALREAGLTFDLERVDLRAKKLAADGSDFNPINPKSQVPVLELDDGTRLTEGAVILQYIADQRPRRHLASKPGTMDRYREMEMLNFISSEIHKNIAQLFNPAIADATKAGVIERAERRFAWLDARLADREFVMGDHWTVADAYLTNMLNWAKGLKFDLTKWPNLSAYETRMNKRPKVRAAKRAEGIK